MGCKNKETLCWRCKRPGTNTCSWDKSRGTVPVDGWTAEEVPYIGWHENRATTSFFVIECPLFDPMEDYYKRMRMSVPREEVAHEDVTLDRPKKLIKRPVVERLIESGLYDIDISERLGLSIATVRKYRWRFRKKQREQERKDTNEN